MRRLALVLLLGLLAVVPACKKRTGRKPVPTVEPVVFLPVPLAQRLPKDVEACFCTVNLNKHRQALLKTHFWRLAAAYLDDKAPTAGQGAHFLTQFLKTFDVEDIALSAGQGSGTALAIVQEVREFYDEARYRMLLRGILPAASGGPIDVAMLDALLLSLERLEVPPLLFGMRGEKAHEKLKTVSDWLTTFPRYAEAATASITTTMGEHFGVTEVDVGAFWPKAARQAWLESVYRALPGLDDVAKAKLGHAMDVIASKPVVIVLGRGKDTAFMGIAHHKDQIRLSEGVEDSVVSREELKFAQAHAARDMLGFAYWQPVFAKAFHQAEPTGALRMALAGLDESLAQAAEAVGAGERAWRAREFHVGAAAAWWEDGLQAEMRTEGGRQELALLQKPSRFQALADRESVVLAACGHGADDGLMRQYVESWMELLDTVVVKSGDSSPWLMLLKAFKPMLLDAYAATKALWQDGLGTDGAVILDTGGVMPPLPGLPAEARGMAMPRLVSAHHMTRRAVVGEAWGRLENALGKALAAIPPELSVGLPPVEVFMAKGLVSYFYPLSFGSEDFMPCASISDDLLLWGTSRAQQHELAGAAAGPAQAGSRFKLDFGRLREFLRAFVKARGGQSPGDASLRETVRWLGPLGVLEWRLRGDGRFVIGNFSLGLKDIPAYD